MASWVGHFSFRHPSRQPSVTYQTMDPSLFESLEGLRSLPSPPSARVYDYDYTDNEAFLQYQQYAHEHHLLPLSECIRDNIKLYLGLNNVSNDNDQVAKLLFLYNEIAYIEIEYDEPQSECVGIQEDISGWILYNHVGNRIPAMLDLCERFYDVDLVMNSMLALDMDNLRKTVDWLITGDRLQDKSLFLNWPVETIMKLSSEHKSELKRMCEKWFELNYQSKKETFLYSTKLYDLILMDTVGLSVSIRGQFTVELTTTTSEMKWKFL